MKFVNALAKHKTLIDEISETAACSGWSVTSQSLFDEGRLKQNVKHKADYHKYKK